MRCAISQPTYFPWAGYFNLVASVDVFVFLDDVQFESRSWQCRNRVLVNGKTSWITVPVKRQEQTQIFSTIEIDDAARWRAKHIKTLQNCYARSPFRDEMLELVPRIGDMETRYLCDLNMAIIRDICQYLRIETSFIRASDLGMGGKRSQHLMNICRELGANTYLSPQGSRAYLEEDGIFVDSDVLLQFQDYQPGIYSQQGSGQFISHLSILDVVANIGFENASKYIRGNYS